MTTTILTAVTARPIRFTADIPAWQRILTQLGGTLINEQPGWLVYQMGSGRVALHASSEAQPAGQTLLALETPQALSDAVVSAAGHGVPITLEETDHGSAGVVRADDGVSFTLDLPTPGSPGPEGSGELDSRLSVLQIWYTKRTREALDTFDGLGLKRRVIGHDGTWTDLICPGGGLAAVHLTDEPVRTELAFEFAGDLEQLIEPLTEIGVQSALIDESYSRTLQLADPDGGKAIWINEKQTDLYGYTLAEM